MWAGNQAAITTGTGVSVDGLRHDSAPLAAIAALALRLPVPWAMKAIIRFRGRWWHSLQSAHVVESLRCAGQTTTRLPAGVRHDIPHSSDGTASTAGKPAAIAESAAAMDSVETLTVNPLRFAERMSDAFSPMARL
jgi:hypothetical protein